MKRVTEYFKNPSVSQSKLTDLSIDPRRLDPNRIKSDPGKTHFRTGSALDVLITGDMQEFQKEFYVMVTASPTGQMLDFVEACLGYCTDSGRTLVKDIPVGIFQNAYDDVGIKRDSFDKFVYTRFPIEGYKYLQALLSSKDKTVLTQVEAEIATAAADSLLTHQFTKGWIAIQPEDGERYKYLYQVPIYFRYKDIDCKALIDVIRLDSVSKKVAVMDVKSTGNSTLSFSSSVLKFRYDLQAAWYLVAVKEFLNQEDMGDWEFEGFRFIVESTKGTGRPLVYKMSPKDLLCGKLGGVNTNGKSYKGYDQLLDEYIFHKSVGQWHYPKEAWDSAGEITLDLYQ